MLTDMQCRKATCPADSKRLRLTDRGGLYIEIATGPRGTSKRWFWKFYPDGKESRLALGHYPEVTLKAARAARDEARKTKQSGANPLQERKAAKLSTSASSSVTFEGVARDFAATKASGWSANHLAQWTRCVEKDLLPFLGALPLASVTAPMLLDVLRKIEARGTLQMAHDVREYAGQVFRFGIVTARCDRNPAADLRGALKPTTVKHMGAVLEPAQAATLLRSIDGYVGQPITRAALALSALLFQRPGNIRAMEWSEVDVDASLWTIPAASMKRTVSGKVNGRPHLVPLAPQALAILEGLRPLTGQGRYVFPSLLGGERCMSENTLRSALRRMGYSNDDMTPHGFRAMARTIMVERLNVNPEIIEAQLAHGKSGPLGSAYDRAEYLQQRRAMMRAWADYLDQLRVGSKVLPLKAA